LDIKANVRPGANIREIAEDICLVNRPKSRMEKQAGKG
jgi:hypothetical protein